MWPGHVLSGTRAVSSRTGATCACRRSQVVNKHLHAPLIIDWLDGAPGLLL